MSENETIADIVAEMREDMPRVVDTRIILRNYADRIEAAYRRECAEVREIAATTVLEDTKYVPANAAKLYKALKEAVICLRNGCDPDSCPTEEEIWNVIKECEAALAVPLRECDRFDDDLQADNLHAAFVKYCNDCDCPMGCIHRMEMKGLLNVQCASILKCFARFALSEADTEKEGAE